jgi:hypothetical protein
MMRMCSACGANPAVSDGKCSVCLKDLAGTQPAPKHGDRRRKTPRGVRVSTPSWAKPKRESSQRHRAAERPD